MIDDYDRCEWVNVSSGTGSSCTVVRTNPESHKTGVCMYLKSNITKNNVKMYRFPCFLCNANTYYAYFLFYTIQEYQCQLKVRIT